MAKQTFTTGQVLTAAQMTSLQQTAMLGGAASAKTASYTLVAADAGTAISMDNASATTITVNTALFAAGDTVHITNLGAGVCTITAGTATVNTSASLALAQYESGFLDFTSTSAAIFVKGAGAAGAVGDNFTLLNAGGTSLTGATTTISGISSKGKIYVIVVNCSSASAGGTVDLRINSDSGNNYFTVGPKVDQAASYAATNLKNQTDTAAGKIGFGQLSSNSASVLAAFAFIDGANSSGVKPIIYGGSATAAGGSAQAANWGGGMWTGSATVSSISILSESGNFDAGTVYVYTSA